MRWGKNKSLATNLSLNPSSSENDYTLSRVCNVNKQKQKEETAGSNSGSSLNQKRRSLCVSFSHHSWALLF